MNVSLNLNNNKGFSWEKMGKVSFKGCVYYKNKNIKIVELHKILESINCYDEFQDVVKNLNGIFIIVYLSKEVYVAVDRLRSLPIFYSLVSGKLIIGDELESFSKDNINSVSKDEFLLAGYVSGSNTIFDGIKQMEASQILTFSNEVLSLSNYQYFSSPRSRNYEDHVFSKEIEISNRVFERLIKSLNGRTALVPLSGGYDSRFIVTMLRRLNYQNVVCFTYGKTTSYEVEISKKVASILGYKHIFVEYTPETWEKTFNNDFFELFNYCFNGSSLPHFQDIYAINYIKQNKIVSDDAIIIPGHSGDLIGGSHQRSDYSLIKKDPKYLDIEQLIYFVHYGNKYSSKSCDNIKQRLRTQLKKIPSSSALTISEVWNIFNRQSKYIVNSVRVYEYLGYEYRIPLWDNELTDYFMSLPSTKRLSCVHYNNFLENVFESHNINFKKKEPLYKNKFVNDFKKILPSFLFSITKNIYVKYSKKINDVNEFEKIENILLGKLSINKSEFVDSDLKQLVAAWVLNNNDI